MRTRGWRHCSCLTITCPTFPLETLLRLHCRWAPIDMPPSSLRMKSKQPYLQRTGMGLPCRCYQQDNRTLCDVLRHVQTHARELGCCKHRPKDEECCGLRRYLRSSTMSLAAAGVRWAREESLWVSYTPLCRACCTMLFYQPLLPIYTENVLIVWSCFS
jgi:hypothetical protein